MNRCMKFSKHLLRLKIPWFCFMAVLLPCLLTAGPGTRIAGAADPQTFVITRDQLADAGATRLSLTFELSRANIVLNPFLGLRYKASVVTTDLPLEPDKPVDFGLQDFCDKCMKCADLCPSRSISSGEKQMINGYERWEFNSDTCMKYRFSNPKGVSCGKCIKVCPQGIIWSFRKARKAYKKPDPKATAACAE